MANCPICGSKIYCEGEVMESDRQKKTITDFDDRIEYNFHCNHCGAVIFVTEPSETEKLQYDYWKELYKVVR